MRLGFFSAVALALVANIIPGLAPRAPKAPGGAGGRAKERSKRRRHSADTAKAA